MMLTIPEKIFGIYFRLALSFVLALGCSTLTQSKPLASIYIDTNKTIGKVSPLLLGNNILVSRNAGGLLSTDSGVYNSYALAKFKELKISLLRFPGGGRADEYHWRQGIGPSYKRPNLSDQFGPLANYNFGTDEFLSFCKQIGCGEQLITVNIVSGTAQEAANWVEYCNSAVPANPNSEWKVDSYGGRDKAPKGYFAWLREQYGHREPYGVKYWEIGNEPYLFRPQMAPQQYSDIVTKFSSAMKKVDPNITVGAVLPGIDYNSRWRRTLLETASNNFDFWALHYYTTLKGLPPVMAYYANASHTRKVKVDKPGNYAITVTANGTMCEGVGAFIDLSIDNKVIHTFTVSSTDYQTYSYTCRLNKGTHNVSLAFTNDKVIGREDRNAFISSVKIAPTDFEGQKQELWFPGDSEMEILESEGKRFEQRIEEIRNDSASAHAKGSIPIMITEGNMGYMSKNGDAYTRRLKAALWVAGLINAMAREQITAYCHWNLIDKGPWGTIRTNPDYVTPSYYALQLYSQYLHSRTVSVKISMEMFHVPSLAPSEPDFGMIPYVDAIATVDDNNHSLSVIAINWHSSAVKSRMRIDDAQFSVKYKASVLYTEDKRGADADNDPGSIGIRMRTAKGVVKNGSFEYELPGYSISAFEIPFQKK
ncbi:MAG: carbohydrate-binding domain-containing protein [Armatimonadota bacterium]